MPAWRQKLAIQLASQLPDDPQDARIVLKMTGELLEAWLVDKSQTCELIRLFYPEPETKPVEPAAARKPWLLRYAIGALTVVAAGIATFGGTKLEAQPRLTIKMAYLESQTIRRKESLRTVSSMFHTDGCPGILRRIVFRDGREMWSVVLPTYPHEIGVWETVTRTIDLPDLEPGEYWYETTSDRLCADGRQEHVASPRLYFRVVD